MISSHHTIAPSIILLIFIIFSLQEIEVNSVAIKPEALTLDFLKSIRSYAFSGYDFIILDKNLLTQDGYVDTEYLPVANNIRYRYTDCKDNLLQVCESHRNAPIILIYNKVLIEYEEGWIDKFTKNQNYGSEKHREQMKESVKIWAKSIFETQPLKNVKTKEQIEKYIQEFKSVYIMVENKTLGENQISFRILTKNFYSEKFIYYTDIALAESLDLNLTEGKFLHLTQNSQMNWLPQVSTPRYEIWKAFMNQQLFWNLRALSQSLTKNRFNFEQLAKMQQSIIFCDMGLPCLKFMKQLNQAALDSNNQDLKKLSKSIIDSSNSKNVKIIELYYHVKLTGFKMPLLLVIDGLDQQNDKLPARYLTQINQHDALDQIRTFWKNIESGEIKSQHLSSGIPKKNGYYGKGSEKLIQKLSYETYKQAILKAHKEHSAFYFLFITAVDFECPKCTEIYSQIKKFASYLKSQDREDVKFGMFDLSSNQIDLQEIQNIPIMLLFKPGSIDETSLLVNSGRTAVFYGSYTFDSLNRFLVGEKNKQENNEL